MYDFQQLAGRAIDTIRNHDKVPILVGGTGLYVDSVLFNYQPGDDVDQLLRQSLEQMTVAGLQSMIETQHLSLPKNSKNKRHLIRTLERGQRAVSRQKEPLKDTIVVGIATNADDLEERIRNRAEHMFCPKLMQETQHAADAFGWDCEGLSGNIYRLVHQILTGELTRQQAVEKSVTLDRQLAKRQMTWFKRNGCIHWLPLEATADYIASELTRYDVQPVIP
jgi:tRNA dimethylallyltransferase